MGTIEEIIKAIDDKLIENGKPYMNLGTANSLLAAKNIITISEKFDNKFKELLETNQISHAFQTNTIPKQWRIPLSEKGQKRVLSQKVKLKNKPISTNSFNENYAKCPTCGINLFLPKEIENEKYIQCLTCGKSFKNPLRKEVVANKDDVIRLTKKQRNWIIAVVIIVFVLIIGNFKNSDSSSSNTLYFINNTTYAATSQANFDGMSSYVRDGDEEALSHAMLNGEVELISSGTNVYLVSSHFSYSIVRLKGSSENLWVITEYLTKK
jgi:hypothetical protein